MVCRAEKKQNEKQRKRSIMKMIKTENINSKVKRWFLPMLGGVVVVLALAAPTSAKAQCYYYAKMIPCHYASHSTKPNVPCGVLTYTYGVGMYTTSYASVASCVTTPYGNGSASSSSAFSGSCTYNYEDNICGKTYKGQRTSTVNLNNCLGNCSG